MKFDCRSILTTLLLSFFFWFICSPVSTDSTSDGEKTLLLLSLEEAGRTTAEFSGTPIVATIELDRDTVFNVLNWHIGQGDPIFNDSLVNKKTKRFVVLFSWNRYPKGKDSASGIFIDTVYVSIGGSLKKSNKVFIKVTNLPVVIDSALFNTKLFEGVDTIWRYSFSDTAPIKSRYPLRIYTHDLDNTPVSLQILGPKKGKILRKTFNSSEMEYEPPSGNYSDSISFIAYDQKGGQVIRRLIINRTTPNILPVIDSIQIQSTILKGSGLYSVGYRFLDTLKLRLFAHDSEGSIKQVVWKSRKFTVNADSTNKLFATWICTEKICRDTMIDTIFTIDTITVKVVDERNDSIQKSITLYKGSINQPPILKELLFDEKKVSFSDTLGTVSTAGGFSYMIKIRAADSENETLQVAWKGFPASRISNKTDSTLVYSAPTLRDTDTVNVTISDGLSSITRTVKVIINDIGPILDSISIKDTLIKNPDAIVSYRVAAGDTILLIAYSYDRDKQEDSLSYLWTAGMVERFTIRQSNRARYILPVSNLKDTIKLTLQDGTVQIIRKIVLLPANEAPVIDSILSNGVKLKNSTTAIFNDQAKVSDTIAYTVFTHDQDQDAVTIQWSAPNSAFLSSLTGKSTTYLCPGTIYLDTISVKASDIAGANVIKKIIISIDLVKTQ